MKILGISGKKRAGKDTLLSFLGEYSAVPGYLPIIRKSFADPLRQEVADFLVAMKITKSSEEGISLLLGEDTKEEFRPLMQWWGTNYRRKYFGEDYWVRAFEASLSSLKTKPVLVVVPDVRFPDEAKFIESIGGSVIRVERIGLENADQHPSETSLDNYPNFGLVVKASNLTELKEQAQKAIEMFVKAKK